MPVSIISKLGISFLLIFCVPAQAQSDHSEEQRHRELDLQERCAKQAEKMFSRLEGKPKEGDVYQSHYNTRLRKCFMVMEVHSMAMSVSKNMMDPFDQRPYASYFWKADAVKKHWEVPPMVCELIPSHSERRNCTSDEEFEEFVAPYMEE